MTSKPPVRREEHEVNRCICPDCQCDVDEEATRCPKCGCMFPAMRDRVGTYNLLYQMLERLPMLPFGAGMLLCFSGALAALLDPEDESQMLLAMFLFATGVGVVFCGRLLYRYLDRFP